MADINDLESFAKRIRIMHAIESIIDELGETMVKTIQTRVRLGGSVLTSGGVKTKFAPLKPSTIKKRERLAAQGKLFAGSTAKRSHLTMTGDMMEQLMYKKEPTQLTILFKTDFADDKAMWAHEGTRYRAQRPFMFLSDKEAKQATKIIQKGFDAYIDGIAKGI
jgi:hypothetical protein